MQLVINEACDVKTLKQFVPANFISEFLQLFDSDLIEERDKYKANDVRPGLTGLAQVSGYRGETSDISLMEGRIKKDITYIENWSLWLDVKICIHTIRLTLLRDNKAF